MTENRQLLLAEGLHYSDTPPRGANPLARCAWHAYNHFAPHVRESIRRGEAGSELAADAFRAYGRPMSRRDRIRAFDELMRLHAERGGGVL